MCSIWSSFLSLNRAPTTWGKADMEIFIVKCVLSFPSLPFVRMTGKQTTWQLHIILRGILTMSGVLWSKKNQKNLSMLMPTRTDLLGQNNPLLNSQQLVNPRKGQKRWLFVWSQQYSWLISQLSNTIHCLGRGSVFWLRISWCWPLTLWSQTQWPLRPLLLKFLLFQLQLHQQWNALPQVQMCPRQVACLQRQHSCQLWTMLIPCQVERKLFELT